MLSLKVVKNNGDSFFTSFDGSIEDAAKQYFVQPDTSEIYFLHGGDFKNDYITRWPIRAYRVPEEKLQEYELFYQIRCDYGIFYKQEPYPASGHTEVISAGLTNVRI